MSPAQAAARILEELTKYGPVLDEVRTASHRPHCRFNLSYDWTNPAGILLPHLAKIKGLCQILELRAVAELQSGQIESAVLDLQLMFYLTDAIREPFLISHLVRIASFQLSMQALWEGLAEHNWSDAQLRAWQARLRQYDFVGDLKFALEAERAWADRIIDCVKNSNRRGDYYNALADPGNEIDHVAAPVFGLCPSGWLDLEKLNYNRLFQDFFLTGFEPQNRRISPSRAATNDRLLQQSITDSSIGLVAQHRVFARLLLPALTMVSQKFGLAQITADQAVVACALERFQLANGRYPEKLDALTPGFLDKIPHDVISGDPLKYRRSADGRFILYSVGWNEKDDGGTPGLTQRKSPAELSPWKGSAPDLMQGDWVWRFPEP